MGRNIKVSSRMERKMDLGDLNGLMGAYTRENSKIMIYMVKENINGRMVEFMKVIGSIIKNMELVSLNLLMDASMKDNMWMIRKVVRVFLNGLMEESMRDIGKLVSNMVEEGTQKRQVKFGMENGMKVHA